MGKMAVHSVDLVSRKPAKCAGSNRFLIRLKNLLKTTMGRFLVKVLAAVKCFHALLPVAPGPRFE